MTNKQREQTSREAFEYKYRALLTGLSTMEGEQAVRVENAYFSRKGNGQYARSATQDAWMLWQAATQWADR